MVENAPPSGRTKGFEARHLLIVSLALVAFLSCENAKDPVSTLGQGRSNSEIPPCIPGPGVVCNTPTPYPVPNCPDCPCLLPGMPGIANVPYCTPTPTPTPTNTPEPEPTLPHPTFTPTPNSGFG